MAACSRRPSLTRSATRLAWRRCASATSPQPTRSTRSSRPAGLISSLSLGRISSIPASRCARPPGTASICSCPRNISRARTRSCATRRASGRIWKHSSSRRSRKATSPSLCGRPRNKGLSNSKACSQWLHGSIRPVRSGHGTAGHPRAVRHSLPADRRSVAGAGGSRRGEGCKARRGSTLDPGRAAAEADRLIALGNQADRPGAGGAGPI